MAIQLPRIQEDPRAAGAAPAPRISAPALDVQGPGQRMHSALATAGNDILRFAREKQYQESDTIAQNARNQMMIWTRKQWYGDPETGQKGLFQMEGDPQVNFQNFQTAANNKLAELSSAPNGQDWSGMTQNMVNRRLNQVVTEMHDEELGQYGRLKSNYDKGIRDTSVQLAQQSMPSASVLIDPDRPETFEPLQGKIKDIEDAYKSFGAKYGGVVTRQNDDGTQSTTITPTLQQQISNEVSKGLYGTIDNLYDSDQGSGVQTAQANAIRQNFADYLNPLHKDALINKANATAQKNQAIALSSTIISKGDDAPEVQAADPVVRLQAEKIAAEHTDYIKKLQTQQQDQNYETLMKGTSLSPGLIQAVNSGQVESLTQLQNFPLYKKTQNLLSSKQIEAVQNMVTGGPKSTPDTAMENYLNVKFGNVPGQSLRDMDPSQFYQLIGQFDKQDRAKALSDYEKLKSPSGAQIETENNLTGKEFDLQSVAAGMAYRMPGTNYIQAKDLNSYLQLKNQMLDGLEGLPLMSPSQRRQYVANTIANYKAGQTFQAPQAKTFNGSAQPPVDQAPATQPTTPVQATPAAPTTTADPRAAWNKMDDATQTKWFQQFRNDPNKNQYQDIFDYLKANGNK